MVNIRSDTSRLESQTERALKHACDRAREEKTTLVARDTPGRLWIVDFLAQVELARAAQVFIRETLLFELCDGHKNIGSLGEFMQKAGSLLGALKKAEDAQRTAYVRLEDDLADYFVCVKYCFLNAKLTIQRSKPISSAGPYAGQEFCSLCWRLVNKFALQNSKGRDGYSTHYCAEHHPTLVTQKYHKARRALISAAKHRGAKADKSALADLTMLQKSRLTGEEVADRMTKSFVREVPKIDLLPMSQLVDGWLERASQLLIVIKRHYPKTFPVISQLPMSSRKNWGEWFLSVIDALDDSGCDIVNWTETGDFSDKEKAKVKVKVKVKDFDDDTVGWRVLLNICGRHEAFQTIALLPRPRGPKKGSIEKNLKIREEIKRAVLKRQKKGLPVVWAQIAKEIGVSRQRVSILVKEMDLS